MNEPLREGFTTGTAASAAAFAAVSLLCGRSLPATVETPLPPFPASPSGADDRACCGSAILAVPVEDGGLLPGGIAWASVIKDGGDDPDATHGARVVVHASLSPFSASNTLGCGPATDTPQFARLEQAIRQCPELWLWSHKRWKHKPPPNP